MSAKTGAQPGRRTPLSLSGASKQQQQQQQQQSQQLPRPSANLGDSPQSNSRQQNDNHKTTTTNQKTEQATTNMQTNRQTKQQIIAEKRAQQQQQQQQQITRSTSALEKSVSGSGRKSEKNEEKRTQNGVGSSGAGGSGNGNYANGKEKSQNGKEAKTSDAAKEKRDSKAEKMDRNEKVLANIERKEKQEQELEKKKQLEKEKEKEKLQEQKENEKEKLQEQKENEKEKEREKQHEKQQEKQENMKEVEVKDINAKEAEKEKAPEKMKETGNKSDEIKSGTITVIDGTPHPFKEINKKPMPDLEIMETVDLCSLDEEKPPQTPTKPGRKSVVSSELLATPTKQAREEDVITTNVVDTPPKSTEKFKLTTPSKSSVSSSTISTTTSVSVTTKSVTTTIDDGDDDYDDDDAEDVPEPMDVVDEDAAVYAKVPSSTEARAAYIIEDTRPSKRPSEPTATSTPGKYLKFKQIFSTAASSKIADEKPSSQTYGYPRTLSHISGRRSIRGGTANEVYTTSYVHSKSGNYRESYRRINTELDVANCTGNTSLNVTVGSEVPNNSSFSFFGRGRKRDRTPPKAAMDVDESPKSPKRARIDMHGFLSAVASPLSLLRSRFSKTSIQSSTPMKGQGKPTLTAAESAAETAENGDDDVQNVSGISVDEDVVELTTAAENDDNKNNNNEVTVGNMECAEKETMSAASSSSHSTLAETETAANVGVNKEADDMNGEMEEKENI